MGCPHDPSDRRVQPTYWIHTHTQKKKKINSEGEGDSRARSPTPIFLIPLSCAARNTAAYVGGMNTILEHTIEFHGLLQNCARTENWKSPLKIEPIPCVLPIPREKNLDFKKSSFKKVIHLYIQNKLHPPTSSLWEVNTPLISPLLNTQEQAPTPHCSPWKGWVHFYKHNGFGPSKYQCVLSSFW